MQTTDPSNFFRTETDLALEDARKIKSERTKNLGSPIEVTGKPLAIEIRNGQLWAADSGFVARRIDLESGSVKQVYRGHAGPVTCLHFVDDPLEPSRPILITGSWDKNIILWDTQDKSIISTTNAHADFVKTVLAVPKLKLLISGGADKCIRFWDLSHPRAKVPLASLGFLSSHTRPVQCIAIDVHSESTATLFTADSMGVIKVWDVERKYGETPDCRGTQIGELSGHRTSINDMWYEHGHLWTASADDTVLLQYFPPSAGTQRPIPPLTHPKAVKAILPLAFTALVEPYIITAAGELIRVFDVSTPGEPELLHEVDAHWHDVTALRLWMRNSVGDRQSEPWIISASLDGTIRKWRLKDLLEGRTTKSEPKPSKTEPNDAIAITAEEERELAELMDGD